MGRSLPCHLLICSFAVKVNPALALQGLVAAGAGMHDDSGTIGTAHISGSILENE
jgi:hypothetical protein